MIAKHTLRRSFRLPLTDAAAHDVADAAGTAARVDRRCRYLVAAFAGTGCVWLRLGGLAAAPGDGYALTQEVGPREIIPREHDHDGTMSACKDAAGDDDTVITVEEWEPAA